MFIVRSKKRKVAPVADSWERLEKWYKKNLPEVYESLRPPATKKQSQAFEKATGLTIPDDWRESLLIHDGGEGAIMGMPFDSLEKDQRSLAFFRSLVAEEHDRDVDDPNEDDRYVSHPAGAIKLQDNNANWIPLGNWDGSCWGVDLDPGPAGVSGQIINFGRDMGWKYAIARSFGQFLQDLADELEAGHYNIERYYVNAFGHHFSTETPGSWATYHFGPPKTADMKKVPNQFHNYYHHWSKAKLPDTFQAGRATGIERPSFGELATGKVCEQATALVQNFFEAMFKFECKWLEIRPINKLGYKYVEESVPGMSGSTRPNAIINARRGWSTIGLGHGFASKCYGLNATPMPKNEATEKKLQVFKHTKQALRERLSIRKRFLTDRQRSDALSWEQRYPPAYEPARNRVAEVRLVSPKELIVYMQPVDAVTTRYHLKRVGKDWLIDIKDQTTDHFKFKRVPV